MYFPSSIKFTKTEIVSYGLQDAWGRGKRLQNGSKLLLFVTKGQASKVYLDSVG